MPLFRGKLANLSIGSAIERNKPKNPEHCTVSHHLFSFSKTVWRRSEVFLYCVQTQSMAPIYECHKEGHQGFTDEPEGSWSERWGWKKQESRKIEGHRLSRDVEQHTRLYFDEEGLVRRDIQPINPAIPSLRGTVVHVSYVYNDANSRNLTLDVGMLYGQRGIAAILRKPYWEPDQARIPCNMRYLRQKVRELQRLPKIE